MIAILFLLIVFMFLLICVAVFYYRAAYKPFQLLKNHGFEGPKPVFFYGNYKEKVEKGVLKFTEECNRKFGPTFCTYKGTAPELFTTDLELIKLVCIKDSEQFLNRPNYHDLMDKTSLNMFGLLQKKDKEWRTARNTISPTFSASKLKAMTPILIKCAEELSKVLMDAASSNQPIDVSKIFANYSMEAIMHTAFGHPIKVQHGESDSLTSLASGLFNSQQDSSNSSGQFMSVILSNLPWLRPILRFQLQRSRRVQEYYLLGRLARDLIKKRREDNKPGTYKDFLQLLIEATVEDENGRKMSDEEIISQCILFMMVGFETTSTALTYTAYLLALHPDIQLKLHKEIDEYFSQNPDVTLYQACTDIVYLDMVILESLRIYPPAPRFARVCSRDYHYKGRTIPAGTTVIIPNFLVLKDPRYWNDPERFDPFRFTSEQKSKRPQHCYIPFGLGPRNCVGMRFSLLELKLALIKSLRKVSFAICHETEVPLDVVVGLTMTPKNGVFLKIEHHS